MSAESNPASLRPERAALRRRFRALRRAVVGDLRLRSEADIASWLTSSASFRRAERIALYRAFDGEVGLKAVEDAALAAGKGLLYARVTGPLTPLDFVIAEAWQTRRKGLPEPIGTAVPLAATDLLIVPGVAFDATGARLGFGGGHYDRTLADSPASAIGVCFECQRIERLPHAPWDVPVRSLITERGVSEFDIEECQV